MINRILVLYDGNKAHIFCLVNEFLFFLINIFIQPWLIIYMELVISL